MSESTPEVTTPVETEPPATDVAEETTPGLGDAGKKAIDAMKAERDAARREARTNAEAAKRLQEIEDSQKTEQQRLTDQQKLIERERDEARAEGLRYKAAAKHGVNEDYFDLLGSGDEDTIVGRAERVGGLLRENADLKAEVEALKAGKPSPSSQRPATALKPGATPEDIKPPDDDSYPSDFLPRRMRGQASTT